MMSDHPNNLSNFNNMQDALSASDMLEALAALTVKINSRDFLPILLNPNVIYCSKTGQPIGQRDANSVFSAISIFGKTRFIENAYSAHGSNIHPAWVGSNGEALDALLDKDPIAYASYTLGLICQKYLAKPVRYDRQAISGEHWALARCYAIIRQANLPPADLLEFNFKCCELLTFGENAARLIAMRLGQKPKGPDYLAMMAVSGTLQPLLTEAIEAAINSYRDFGYAMNRQRFEDIPSSPADAARGPSNVRQQKRSRARVRVSNMAAQFAEFGLGGPIVRHAGKMYPTKQTGNIFDIINANNRNVTLAGLDALADMDLSHSDPTEHDENANEVEVSFISRKEADIILGHEPENIVASIIPQEPKVSGLSPLLAGLIKQQATIEPVPQPVKVEAVKQGIFALIASNKKVMK